MIGNNNGNILVSMIDNRTRSLPLTKSSTAENSSADPKFERALSSRDIVKNGSYGSDASRYYAHNYKLAWEKTRRQVGGVVRLQYCTTLTLAQI